MSKKIIILAAALMSSCASMNDGRSLDRILTVCVDNALVNYMSMGAGSSSVVTGDAKKVLDTVANARVLEGVCYENERTINQEDL
jgi:hypothetical protein